MPWKSHDFGPLTPNPGKFKKHEIKEREVDLSGGKGL